MAVQVTEDDYAASATNLDKHQWATLALDCNCEDGGETRTEEGHFIGTYSTFFGDDKEKIAHNTYEHVVGQTMEYRHPESSIIIFLIKDPKTNFEIIKHQVFSPDEELAADFEAWLKLASPKHIKKMITLPSFDGDWAIDLKAKTGTQKIVDDDSEEEPKTTIKKAPPKKATAKKPSGAAARKAAAAKKAPAKKTPVRKAPATPANATPPPRRTAAARKAAAKKA